MPHLHSILPGIWLRRGLWACLLLPLSWLYGGLVRVRRLAYRMGWQHSGHPGVPVVVIGNVVAGGAGKTPTTIAVVQHLQAQGWRVGVVSRGHGRTDKLVREVRHDSPALLVGDEPLLIHRRTGAPVWVGSSRLQAAQQLRQACPDVQLLVCDDGLQHLGLQRDLEICLMDERGPGNGWLLPAGPLREPWPRPVDMLLYTDGQAHAGAFTARRALSAQAVNGLGETRPLSAFKGAGVDAVAALAKPQAFFAMLRDQGLTLADTHALPDHDRFEGWTPPATGRPLLCTEKDAVKLWAQHPQAWAVPLQMVPEPAFWQALDHWLTARGLTPKPCAPVSSAHGQQTA